MSDRDDRNIGGTKLELSFIPRLASADSEMSDHDDSEQEQFLNVQAGQFQADMYDIPSDREYHRMATIEEEEITSPFRHTVSYEDFGAGNSPRPKSSMTGRQRKKLAARSKGGEFQV